MKNQVKAIATMIAGTIGVGFLILPYAFNQFGTWGSIVILTIVAFLTLSTNLTYADIVTKDKGNRQISGYAHKYLGRFWGHISMIVTVSGAIGTLLAYAIIAGNTLRMILGSMSIWISAGMLSTLFIITALLVMRYGMQLIGKVSTLAVGFIVVLILLLVASSLPQLNFANIQPINISQFSLIFGSSIFALSSAASIPVIDELIGYNRKKYRFVIFSALIIVLILYILLGFSLSLAYGDGITSDLVSGFTTSSTFTFGLLLVVLLAVFTSFVLMANSIKETLHYDYKLPQNAIIFGIFGFLVWLIIFKFSSFENIISGVGNFSLTIQSLFTLIIWFKVEKQHSSLYKIFVALSGLILLLGIIL